MHHPQHDRECATPLGGFMSGPSTCVSDTGPAPEPTTTVGTVERRISGTTVASYSGYTDPNGQSPEADPQRTREARCSGRLVLVDELARGHRLELDCAAVEDHVGPCRASWADGACFARWDDTVAHLELDAASPGWLADRMFSPSAPPAHLLGSVVSRDPARAEGHPLDPDGSLRARIGRRMEQFGPGPLTRSAFRTDEPRITYDGTPVEVARG